MTMIRHLAILLMVIHLLPLCLMQKHTTGNSNFRRRQNTLNMNKGNKEGIEQLKKRKIGEQENVKKTDGNYSDGDSFLPSSSRHTITDWHNKHHCCYCCRERNLRERFKRGQKSNQYMVPIHYHCSPICHTFSTSTISNNKSRSKSTLSDRSSISADESGIRPEKTYCRLLKENTTFHGIRDMIQTVGLLRTIWLCIIVLASLAALVGCGLIVWEFNTRPLSVTFGIKENGSLMLPDIIVCPFNRFNRTFLQSWNVSDQLAQYLELTFPASSQHPFQYKSYKNLLDNMNALEVELAELLERVGISFAEFIQKSSINCHAFFLNKSLCDTAQELMTMVGKCFRILGEEQHNDGHGHAQRIIVRIPTQLYNPAPNQMMNDGILVKLAERGKGIDHDMSFVPSGVHAIFPLTATRFEFKHYPPHFLCREQDDSTYSPTLCFEKCFLDKAERECNCSLAAATQPGTPNTCTPRQFFNCVYGVLRFDDANVVDEQVAHCKARCLPPCTNWRFDKTVTYAHFPSAGAKHFVKDASKWEDLRNTIILEVFYTTLDYTIIQQMLTITPSSFVAQLGGQISLWIGGSIISLMQLVIYLLSYLCVYFRRTNGTKRNVGQRETEAHDELGHNKGLELAMKKADDDLGKQIKMNGWRKSKGKEHRKQMLAYTVRKQRHPYCGNVYLRNKLNNGREIVETTEVEGAIPIACITAQI